MRSDKRIPMRHSQFKTTDFLEWISRNGAEVGMPSNGYEVVRYKAYTSGATKALTHIVYRKDSGMLTWTGASMRHYQAFLDGSEFIWSQPYEVKTTKITAAQMNEDRESPGAKRRRKLAERDGPDCWFCGEQMGRDCTIEHLVPQSRGGGNDMANLVLAHESCNKTAANLSISEKVELRAKMRIIQNA